MQEKLMRSFKMDKYRSASWKVEENQIIKRQNALLNKDTDQFRKSVWCIDHNGRSD